MSSENRHTKPGHSRVSRRALAVGGGYRRRRRRGLTLPLVLGILVFVTGTIIVMVSSLNQQLNELDKHVDVVQAEYLMRAAVERSWRAQKSGVDHGSWQPRVAISDRPVVLETEIEGEFVSVKMFDVENRTQLGAQKFRIEADYAIPL